MTCRSKFRSLNWIGLKWGKTKRLNQATLDSGFLLGITGIAGQKGMHILWFRFKLVYQSCDFLRRYVFLLVIQVNDFQDT